MTTMRVCAGAEVIVPQATATGESEPWTAGAVCTAAAGSRVSDSLDDASVPPVQPETSSHSAAGTAADPAQRARRPTPMRQVLLIGRVLLGHLLKRRAEQCRQRNRVGPQRLREIELRGPAGKISAQQRQVGRCAEITGVV